MKQAAEHEDYYQIWHKQFQSEVKRKVRAEPETPVSIYCHNGCLLNVIRKLYVSDIASTTNKYELIVAVPITSLTPKTMITLVIEKQPGQRLQSLLLHRN